MEPANAVAEPVARPAGTPSLSPVRPLRLLVGYDGRPASRDALSFAKALCEANGAELTVASVRGYWPELLGESYGLVVKEDARWISRGATEVLGDTPFSVRVLAGGHETAGLKELAEAEESDMIVLGSTHRGRVGRVCPGSTGERVLSDAPCTVAVAPRGLADRRLHFGTIAVGFDGSKQAQVALRTAIDLAKRTGASLRILAVVDTDFVFGTELDPSAGEKERVERRLGHAVEHARRSVEAEGRMLHGIPSHAIPEAAEGADLLIIGSRGHYGAARRLPLGSVAARRVLRTAPCPALITPSR